MNTKEIERRGVQAFKKYLEKNYGGRQTVEDIRDKGNREKEYGCDLIVTIDGDRHFVEIKASRAKSLPTNIRFTHQTIATMYNARVLESMIVVYVYNLAAGARSARFKFFRFGDFEPGQIFVEPHFIIQPKSIIRAAAEEGASAPIMDTLDDILSDNRRTNDIGELFRTRVSSHMKLRKRG